MPVDVALLGCAHPHVRDVLGVVGGEPSMRLVAAWDADPAAVPVGLAGVSRAQTAINRADLVVVCAPTDQRPALVDAAARAGRPVLVEKPIATSSRLARELAADVARTATPARAAFFLRELGALQRLRALLDAGTLGRLGTVAASLTHAGALDGMFAGPVAWMAEPDRAGVGGFGDLGLHLLDALAFLARGELPVLRAAALDRAAGTRGDVAGAGVGLWRGVPLTLQAGWTSRPGGLRLVLAGSAATARLHDGVLELDDGTGSPERWVGAPPDAGEALRAFAADLAARRRSRDGLAGAAAAQATLEAAVRVA